MTNLDTILKNQETSRSSTNEWLAPSELPHKISRNSAETKAVVDRMNLTFSEEAVDSTLASKVEFKSDIQTEDSEIITKLEIAASSSTSLLDISNGKTGGLNASTCGQLKCLAQEESSSKTKKSNLLVVGISGCSSSGKTTLTFLLNEIFNSSASTTTRKHFITQDDFFRPKSELPNVLFIEQDANFVEATIQYQGMSELYDIRPFMDEKMTATWRIAGPNTDCAAAVDFDMFLKAVGSLRRNGQISEELEAQRKARKLGVARGTNVTSDERQVGKWTKFSHSNDDENSLRQKHSSLIEELRGKVEASLEEATENLRFVFVEGFLLFKGPGSTLATKQDLYRQILQSYIDIPLFLPISRSEAKKRRLSRKPYLDPPFGGRLPGQMWKGEGYFEDVVWNEYIAEYGWLLDRLSAGEKDNPGEKIHGIWVCNKDQSVEETLRWGVETILRARWAG